MTKIALLIIVIFYFSTSYAASDTVIKNIQIITYENKFNPEYGYIVISGHKIKNVGKGAYKNNVNNADVIDGKNMFVIPGLIDSHNHIDSILGFDNSTQLKRIDLVNEYRNQLPRSYLYFGYITLIDLSTSDQEIISEFKGQPERPDLFTSGGAITEFNGYPMVFLNEEEKLKKLPNFIMSVENKKTDNIKLKKDHSPEKLVNNILKNSGTFVKVFYEPGFNEQNKFPVPSLNNIKAVIEQSHKKQLPVIMHANSAIAQRFAIKAGADGVAHGLWNWNTGNKTNIMPENIKEILNDIANKKVGYQATIRTMGGLFDLFDENYFSDPNLSKVVPQSLLNWYQTKEGEWFKNEIIEDNDEEKVKNQIKLAYDRALISLGYLAQKEGFLLFASDTPSALLRD
ncbi:amidohydrolase family protein [Silvanigrella aquatica]|uniref:Amidohydrolase-related domain-containing protein n=1 Tax=Silvanigrella aquatica TaxID=1915309 RepID=A0A1L4D2D0_9BACT|nr:hypothetical protein [Silvanigrella aquatica]APJ04350.1 hypothetical protein AXG55_10705 [Silvanigrella aquatica]